MQKIIITIFALALLFTFNNSNAQYLTENFESAWTGSPEAPTGWTQTRTVLIGNGIPDGILSTSGEKDWQRNTNTGVATWSLSPSTPGVVPNGAVSGTGVAWLQSRDFGGSAQNWGSRRLESPIVNLSASTSPYVRFWMFFADGSTVVSLRIMGSSDGGTTWRVLQQVPSNFGQTTVTSATPWERISISIPSDFRTANMKIGIEYTSIWGTNNLFIDDVTIEEFTPTTITSAMTGNWGSTGTWTGGVVPTSDNNVVIAAGHTVTSNLNNVRMQNLTVDGTLNYSSATTTLLNTIQGDLTVSATGTYNSFFSTTGKRTYLGGSLTNAGTINFGISATSTSEATLIFMGYGNANFSNSGTISFGKMNGIWHFKDGMVVYLNPVTITTRAVFGLGSVNPNGNLTLGNSAAVTTMTIEKQKGNLTASPIFGAGVTRSVQYNDGSGVSGTLSNQFAPCNRINTVPGFEVEEISMVRTVTGTLTINTHGNVELTAPLTVGTATTGALTLTRGIVITTPTNILRTTSFFSPGTGVDPSTATPSLTHGSYISGPMRIDFPTSTTSRTFALGVGTSYNDSIPTANVRKAVLFATTTAWTASTSLTGSITAKPSGSMVMGDSSTSATGTRGYYFDLNSGPDLPTNSTINLGFRNYNFGDGSGSDSVLGSQNNIRLIQSTSLTGPWTSRTNASGTGAIVANTNYTRTSPTAAPGPIAPLGTNGGFFAWGTSALTNDVAINSIAPSGTNYYVAASNIPMTGSVINNGVSTTTSDVTVVRRIIGTGYVDTKTVPSGLTPSSTANINFADFSGWTAGVTYTIKDSLYYAGDGVPTNDTLSTTFTPITPKTTIVIYGTDTRSRDSLMVHFDSLFGSSSATDFVDFSVGLPTISLSNWRSVIFCLGSTLNWSAAARDSMKAFLDNASDPMNKKSLLIFGNDLGYNNDPRRNAGALPADTVFYRQYLRAQYWSDDWVDNFVLSDSTLKGLGAFSTITDQRVNDPFPDCVAPALWNQGSGTLTSALIPLTEDGDGDSAAAISYSGTFYNVFYGTNVYANYKGTGFADAPSGQLLEIVDAWIQSQGGSLPVELSSFIASSNRNLVELKWITASEINNSGFDIERKPASGNVWTKIGNVQGSGNSTSPKNYVFNDNNLQTGKYNYRLKQIDYNGNFEYFNLSSEVNVGVPASFDLSQNYPNPFNPMTKINFDLAADSKVSLKVYDMLGREVYSVFNNELKTAGYYTAQLNFGSLASGTYFYRIIAIGLNGQEFITTKKMQLVK